MRQLSESKIRQISIPGNLGQVQLYRMPNLLLAIRKRKRWSGGVLCIFSYQKNENMNLSINNFYFKPLVIGLLFIGLSSCSSEASKDILDYVNVHMKKVSELESEAMNAYASVQGDNFTSDETMYTVINNVVIPKYRNFIDQLEPIAEKIKTPELKAIHEIYIKAANTQFSGFMLVLEGLESGDRMHIVEANQKLDEGRKLIRKYKSELQSLCDKNNVELELS